SLTSCFSFSFYCSADPRYLHSFPTRRSSDLAGRIARAILRRSVLLQPPWAARPGHCSESAARPGTIRPRTSPVVAAVRAGAKARSEEHTSELQSQSNLVCRLLLEKKNKKKQQ